MNTMEKELGVEKDKLSRELELTHELEGCHCDTSPPLIPGLNRSWDTDDLAERSPPRIRAGPSLL